MTKINSFQELEQMCELHYNQISHRLKVEHSEIHKKAIETNSSTLIDILVCGGTGCRASESHKIIHNFQKYITLHNLESSVNVVQVGCFGFCEKGPIVKIMPYRTFYTQVKADDVEEIFYEHIINGRRVTRLLYLDPTSNKHIEDSDHMNFYGKQLRIALRNCGIINPEKIEEYIGLNGYKALAMVLEGKLNAIECIKLSGLRGRGGGGFPTGSKWELAQRETSVHKYVVCNADEGDPGAFMDRSIMEGDPHSVIEAMIICGFSIGASYGLVYIRAEYPLAVHRLQTAINQAREYGLLGTNIMGTNFCFDIDIRYGAGAFVCGEETALIHSMEGKRGEPTPKPPYPAQSGYKSSPTTVNNVETLACISPILLNGWKWFDSIGTAKSKGTKVFALAGKVNNVGLIEVPMGTTLREVIFDIGGGVRGGHEFKAIQTGGPSGGCLTTDNLDMGIDYDNLIQAGSMMGSGGMIVVDSTDCMVQMAKFYLEFTVEESCGKCTPCRIGNRRILEILEQIVSGKATMQDLERLEQMCGVIKETSLCGLGQTAPNPVISTLKNFRTEYLEHIVDKKCRSKKCKALVRYTIDPYKCIGCTLCARNCPTFAIRGEAKKPHEIDQDKCIKCGACMSRCKFNAISINQ